MFHNGFSGRCNALLLATAVALGIGTPGKALAWGVDGHKIVALVAQQFLDPDVKKKVDALLKSDTDKLTAKDIASRAVWADKYRDSDRNGKKIRFNGTRQWHFVDIELKSPNFDKACFDHSALPADTAASKGPAQSCVADKIQQFLAELKNPKTSKAERLLALKFLLHFVGDIHQPLHAADNNDQGGNKVFVIFGKHTVAEKLHAYWDDVLVENLGKDVDQVAAMLANKFKDKKADWMKGDPKAWANESFGQARDVAYKLPTATKLDKHKVKSFVIDKAYDDKAQPVVAEQLAKGGMRLAMILNDALK
jgi:nuclease S1